jgi:prephenate dehydrogenase
MHKKTLSIIGVGAFGKFMASHLYDHFDVILYDPYRDLTHLNNRTTIGTLDQASRADYVVLSVPVKYLQGVMSEIASQLKSGQIVIDIASVKCKPRDIITASIPDGVNYIGLHPLFGPESGKDGIEGLNITVCGQGDGLEQSIIDFLSDELKLNVFQTTAQDHDQQMAYVQGLSHMIGKAFENMNMPDITQSTHSFSLLQQMANNVKNDSDDLFVSIQHDNPYSDMVRERFFESVRNLEKMFEVEG